MARRNDCPACGMRDVEIVVEADAAAHVRFLRYSEIKYDGLMNDWPSRIVLAIDRCRGCGHHWYREQPDAPMLAAMYANGRPLNSGGGKPSREPTNAMLAEMRRLFRLVDKPAPRLLDYGSGFGRWARAAVRVGFSVTAYEPAVVRAAEEGEVDFEVVSDPRVLAQRTFEVINLEQVLEHVPDPFALLCDVRGMARVDTIIRATVPNVLRCPEGRTLWQVWPFDGTRVHTMAPFEHLHGFTPRSLTLLAQRAGLEALRGLDVWSLYGVEQARRLVGRIAPRFGQTLLLARRAT